MAALISSVMDTKDKVPFFVAQAEQMGIEILPPDVNLSDHEFMVVEGNIRFGLDAVKGVGHAAVEAIKAARERGRARSPRCGTSASASTRRCVNKKAIEALIKCGAFGSTGATRKGMLEVLEAAQEAGQKAQLDAQIGQSLDLRPGGFGDAGDGDGPAFARPVAPADPDRRVRPPGAAGAREGVGRPVHLRAPAQGGARGAARQGRLRAAPTSPDRKDGDWVKIGGMVSAAKKIRTRSGSMMMFATHRRPRGQRRGARVREGARRRRGRARRGQRSCSIRGRVDHMDGGKICVIVSEVDAVRARREAEIEQGAKAGGRQAEKVAGAAQPAARRDPPAGRP